MTPLRELADLLLVEGKRRILLMATLLSVIALAALGIGLVFPKRYDASTLVAVGTGAVIKPLMEGRGVPTGTVEHATITLQITEGKKILRELLVFGGWEEPDKPIDPREQAKLIVKLRSRIKVDAPKEGIIRISYSDTDPDRTYRMANKLAEIYIRESGESQVRDSREAFEFIDKQVKEYGDKLANYHQEVLAHYAQPGRAAGIAQPRQRRAAISAQELAALRGEKATLEAQLGKKAPGSSDGRPAAAEAAAARVRQLETELGQVLAKYTEQHPDVRRVQRDLAAARQEQQRAESARAAADADAQRAAALDAELLRAAHARLQDVNQRIAAATGASFGAASAGAAALASGADRGDPELRGIGQDTKLSELVRRYEATRDVYQDLLKRRESARVAMELTAEHRGAALRIQELAEFPVAPSGLRLMHFCIVGLVLGALVPFGVLCGIVRLDGRVRIPQQVEALGRVPLLVSIAPPPRADSARFRARRLVAILLVFGVCAIYIATFLLKQRAAS